MAISWRDQYLRYKEFYLNIQALYRNRADLRAFLEIILSLATIIIFLLFALKPTALTIISLVQDIREKQKTVSALTQKADNLQTAAGLIAQNQSVISDIDVAVSGVPRPDFISQQIQALATKDSVIISGISTGGVALVGNTGAAKTSTDLAPLPDDVEAMEISISAKGSYAALISFVKDFESLRMITKIDALGINTSTTDQGKVIVAVISGRVPYLGQ